MIGDGVIAGSGICSDHMMLRTTPMSCKSPFIFPLESTDCCSASVYSTDLYETKFAKDPMNGEEGRRYREMVLGWGGSRPEMEFLEEYLGRKPNGNAFARAIAA